jgi:hypothetical protein
MATSITGRSIALHTLHELLGTVICFYYGGRLLNFHGTGGGDGTISSCRRNDPHIRQFGFGWISLLIPAIRACISNFGFVKYMNQIGPVQVLISQTPEYEIYNRRG